jgi:citronellol/citronellal dehydrogenase
VSEHAYDLIIRAGTVIDGTTMLVTGGGSGIGRCTAHELAALGATIAIVGRDPGKLDAVRTEIEADGGRVSTHVCDIRAESEVVATVETVLAGHGRIDGLVNNAGGQFFAPLKDISTKGFEAVVRNNLTGGFIFMREVYARWMERNGGAIVNMAADAWMGIPKFAPSAAARAGKNNLTETAAAEWAASGVRVNSVACGMIASSGFDNYGGAASDAIRAYAGKIPAQRFGTVSEVSAAIAFLLSPAAAFITGTCLRVDGGGPNARAGWTPVGHDRLVPFDGFHLDSTPDLLR